MVNPMKFRIVASTDSIIVIPNIPNVISFVMTSKKQYKESLYIQDISIYSKIDANNIVNKISNRDYL